MTTLTVNIPNENDLPVLQEILNRFGLTYVVEADEEYDFSPEEIEGFLKTSQDFLDGKTTARSWKEVKEELDRMYD